MTNHSFPCGGISGIGKLIYFLFLLIIPAAGGAQSYFFETYSVVEGLGQSTVFDIIQDENDYVWMGTRDGVSRFDGTSFQNYTIEDGLAPNGVRVILQDSLNRLWFGHTGGGLSIFNGSDFQVFTTPGEIFNSDITSIGQDIRGDFWITTELSGTARIDALGSQLKDSDYELYIGDKLSDRVFDSYQTRDGDLYFVTDAFLKTYLPESNQFEGYSPDGIPTFFLITCMFEDSSSDLWFGTYNGGLYHYISDRDTFRVYDVRDGLSSNWISTISEDHHGNIWVGTWGGGITLINEEGLKVYNESNGLPDLFIRCIQEDMEGNILIGTNENGLVLFKGEYFVSWFEKDGLPDEQSTAVIRDSNQDYWVGTGKGLSRFTPGVEERYDFTDYPRMKGYQVRMLKEDSEKRLWIGTDNDGVFTLDLESGKFSYEPGLNSYISSLTTTAVETDNRGLVWVGTLDGLVSYDYDTRETGYYTQTSGLKANLIESLCFDGERLWIGTENKGICYMANDSIYPLDLSENFTARCMTMDKDNMLWVGTQARGVFVIDPQKEIIVRTIRESDGLLANLIKLMEVDEQNNIYVGTNKGLNILDRDRDMLLTYNHRNGFSGIETNQNAVFAEPGGYIWFGTVDGLIRYNPLLEKKINLVPLTHITGLRVNLENREMSDNLSLRHNENNVIIDYISISLTNPEAVMYRIMMEGADYDWRPLTRQTTVTYPSMAPGKYTFKVLARNGDGIWDQVPVSYTFRIKPPFYKTWWFMLIVGITALTGLVVYIRVRERNLIREKKILEEKVRERTAVVTAQKEELAAKNKDITDSIRYAKRIQFATLPPEIPYKDTFVLFKPKDIVSGDFYWLDIVEGIEFLAAVDCTGHGVPGALMSVIGSNMLNKIVREKGIYKPSEILNHLNTEVIYTLKAQEDGKAIYDGMDLALIAWHPEKMLLEYAGGYNPLVLIRKGEIEEVKANRFAIGRSAEVTDEKKFTNHELEMGEGDSMYIFSDGYADQFGGDFGKKFKSKPMKELFHNIHDKPAEEQKSILNSTIEAWRGELEQVDDILIIGRKF